MKRPRLYLEVADRIVQYIADRNLRAGARLPNERDLGLLLGVSRSTVREAEVVLQACGHIVITSGKGTLVADVSKAPIVPLASLGELELLEARIIVEGAAAALAALTISPEELDQLAALIEMVAGTDLLLARDAEQAFHRGVVAGSHNAALALTVDTLLLAYFTRVGESAVNPVFGERHRQLILNSFAALVAALASRDPVASRSILRNLLAEQIATHLELREQEGLREAQESSLRNRERFSRLTGTA